MIKDTNNGKSFDKKDFIKLFLSIFLGGSLFVFAGYSSPVGNPPTTLNFSNSGTNVLPVYKDGVMMGLGTQTKPGSLAVNAFASANFSNFKKDVNINGNINSSASGFVPTVKVGNVTYPVDVNTVGSVSVTRITTSASNSGFASKRLCSESVGKIIICPPPIPIITLSYSKVNQTAYPSGSTFYMNVNITWSSTNSTSCTSPQFNTNNNISGTSLYTATLYSPSYSTSVSITCVGPDGSSSASMTIHP